MIASRCDFRLVSSDGDIETVVCVNCGRPVRLKNAARKNIVANCNGSDERRWTCHDKPKVGCRAGSSLKSLFATIGITAAPNCSCQRHASEMDARGCDWCEDNLDTIVGWLREEATKRGLPFLDAAGRILVRRAISNARRAAAN